MARTLELERLYQEVLQNPEVVLGFFVDRDGSFRSLESLERYKRFKRKPADLKESLMRPSRDN